MSLLEKPRLEETQRAIGRALIEGDATAIASQLTDPRRFELHRRNFEASLVKVVEGRFPAVAWLVGEGFLQQAAARFVHEHPPKSPCMAEYGEEFPEFLGTLAGAERVPYLRDFATLEWHVGRVAIAAPEAVCTMRAGWPVDELMTYFLNDSMPERLEFDPAELWLEIRGSRGEFSIRRLGGAA